MSSSADGTVRLGGGRSRTCQQVITFLFEYIARELDDEERAAFDRHFGVCPSCVAYLETYLAAVGLGRETLLRLEAEGAAAPLPDELVRSVLAARDRPEA